MDYINPALDVTAVRRSMDDVGRVLIREFLAPHVIDAVARAVAQIDWTLSFRDERGDRALSGEELRAQRPADRAALSDQIHRLAERQFQFSFFTHSMVAAAQRGETDLLTRFVRWMAGDDFMAKMRALSGVDDIAQVYAQATMYTRGNFLLLHDDHVDNEKRRLAYVINLTQQWRPDWGGLLHFVDEHGNVVDTFFPHFNSIALFKVPQNHFVSYVPPFALGERCAVTGWLIGA
jgi:Rps23 Pro-64 3,4-dihydroxylase Tpa1-like proline 4-hydroxylase